MINEIIKSRCNATAAKLKKSGDTGKRSYKKQKGSNRKGREER
jgi:hypothetical protein